MSNRKRLLGSYGGLHHIVHSVDNVNNGQDLIIESLQDCEPIIERAKMLSALEPGKEFRHAAVVPPIVLERAFKEGWYNDEKAWKRWANDPDNRAFRTWPGNL